MHYDQLSNAERAALFALVPEARPMTNNELQERAGLRLDGAVRRRLNNMKLVESTMAGRAYVHELTDAGWRWCTDELAAPPPAAAGHLERSIYGIMAGFARYMETAGIGLADVLKAGQKAERGEPGQSPEPKRDADVEADILSAYRALATDPAEFVKLAELRPRLGDVPREQADAALDRMYRAGRVNLIPMSSPRAVTDKDREAALRTGGDHKHLIAEVAR